MEEEHSGADFTGSHIYSSFHLVPEDYFLHFLIIFFPSRETFGKVNKNMTRHLLAECWPSWFANLVLQVPGCYATLAAGSCQQMRS